MTTEVVAQSPLAIVCKTISTVEFKKQISQALPPGISEDRFTRVCLTALQQNPDIATKDRQSLYNAVVRCAADGLLPDGKQAALVAFGNVVQYMPMIGGLRNIAAKHGIAMATGVVHEADFFEYELGIESKMTHKPAALNKPRGEPIGAWAQARDAEGNIYLEVMGKDDIERVRAVSRSKSSGPWVSQWGEMARKTVGRRLFKSLPLTGLDEREERIIQAADAEMDFNRETGEVTSAPQAAPEPATGRRPRGLQTVVDKAGATDAIDSTATRVNPGGGSEAARDDETAAQLASQGDTPARPAGDF